MLRFLKNNILGAILTILILPSIVLAATLIVPQGGTGVTSCVSGGLLRGNGTSPFTCLTPGNNNQVLTIVSGVPQWATSTASQGTVGTSSAVTVGQLPYWTGANTLGSIATGTLTESATGLEFNATRGLVGGSAVLALTSGYIIPTTASTSDWNTAFNWGNHASEGYVTDLSSFDTSDLSEEGNLYFTNTRARQSISESATGLEYNNLSGVFTISPGYSIPTDVSQGQWNDFYTTPSTRITPGTGLSWAGNTLNVSGGVGLGSVTSVDMTVPTGFAVSGNPITTSGTLALSFASGYALPLTASTTNWQSFYTTPSTRITAGSGLEWSGNTLQSTGGSATWGAIGGDLTDQTDLITELNTRDTNNRARANHTGTQSSTTITGLGTLAGLSSIDISSHTNLAGDAEIVLTGDTLSIASSIARDSELHSAVTLAGTPDYITLAGQVITRGLIDLATDVTGDLPLADGGTGVSLSDPNDDRILFWDDTASAMTWLDIGSNLSITGTTISATGGGGGGESLWATTTDSGVTVLYPEDFTVDVLFGSNATSTAGFWFDRSATTTHLGNGGAGDSVIELAINGVSKWVMGADDSDSDNFVISSGGALGTNNVLTLVSTGTSTLDSNLYITGDLEVGGDITLEGQGELIAVAVAAALAAIAAAVATFTNKRIQPRTASSTSNASLTPDLSSANVYFRTTQTVGLTINAPTGTPVIGETILIYVDSAGAQTLTIDSAYKVFGSAFPASTTAGKTFMLSAQFNGTDWKALWANAI